MQNCRPMRRTGAVSEGPGPFFRCSVHVRLVMAEVWRVPLIQAAQDPAAAVSNGIPLSDEGARIP